ncbi:MAG: translation elongation factor 4, partial [Candidatus Heimdallarchaeaceae archaeon]
KELGFERGEIINISAKEGIGIDNVLNMIIERIPPPKGSVDASLKGLIFDSHFDSYRGVVVNVRLFDGRVKKEQKIRLMAAAKEYNVEEVGIFTPDMKPTVELTAGEVGYIIAGIKDISTTRVGDTITYAVNGIDKPLPGYREVKPMVFSSIYPVSSDDYENLVVALEKLKLNDASLIFEKESSAALGFGFRCGFLGLLHLEVVQERLEREFGLSLVVTAPSVEYRVYFKDGSLRIVDNPVNFPDLGNFEYAEEPYVKASIITPEKFVGNIIKITQQRNGIQRSMTYITEKRVEIVYEIPLAEIIYDFHDKIKSVSKGYASLDYEFLDYRRSELVRLDILISGKSVDALSQIVRKDKAYQRGRKIVKALKEEIPRHLFKIAIQAAIGSKIIARENIGAISKNVLAKCYGGDVTRKRKLLEKQKEGKKRMKKVGNVEIPQRAFVSVLKTRD